MNLEKKLQKIFKDNCLPYEYEVHGNLVEVHVLWGDWKHDHIYLNYIMNRNGFLSLREDITEEDGSDSYSSNHIFIH